MANPNIKDKELHRIAITAIIHRDGQPAIADSGAPGGRKFLITRRSPAKKVHPGRWTVPGGGLTVDDYVNTLAFHNQWYGAVTKGLVREVKEETGLEIADPKFLVDLTFIRPDGIPVLVLSYYAAYISGEVAYDEDTVDHAWVTIDELDQYDLIEGIADEIRDVHRILTEAQ